MTRANMALGQVMVMLLLMEHLQSAQQNRTS
jgi:hypothetical protein